MKGVKNLSSTFGLAAAICAVAATSGCSSSKWAGNWNGLLKPAATNTNTKRIGYSETKPTLTSTLVLSGDGSYNAKIREVTYTGDWKEAGKKITLQPKTYMGMSEESMPKTKKAVGSGTMDSLFKPFVLDEGPDGKTLIHTDNRGTDTFTKAD